MENCLDPDTYYADLERQFWQMHDDEAEDREIQQAIDETGEYPLGHIHNPRRRTETISYAGKLMTVELRIVYGYGATRRNPDIDLYLESPQPTEQDQENAMIAAALYPLKRTYGTSTIEQATLNVYWG